MDFGLGGSALMIATSTGQYLTEFAPVFLLIGGIVLAFGVLERLIDIFRGADNITNRDQN